jgi:hypothetical protein
MADKNDVVVNMAIFFVAKGFLQRSSILATSDSWTRNSTPKKFNLRFFSSSFLFLVLFFSPQYCLPYQPLPQIILSWAKIS